MIRLRLSDSRLDDVVEPRASPDLTSREYEILDLLAASQSTGAIAVRLGIAAKTVSNVVSSVLVKLQVGDRAEAAMRAREAGLGRQGGAQRT